MRRLFTMEISGIRIGIDGDDALRIEEPYALVHPFLREMDPSGPPQILLHLSTDAAGPADPDRFRPLFDSGQAWSLWRDGDRRLLRFQLPRTPRPMWQAVVDAEFTAGTVFAGDALIRGRKGRRVVTNPLNYPLDQLLVMGHLAPRDGLVVHAAGAVVHGAGYLLAGVSGAGKSTVARVLAACGHRVLSDDRIIVRRTDDGYAIWGTPWPGDAAMAVNDSAPLAGLLFLHQDRRCRIAALPMDAALRRLLPVAAVPWYDADGALSAVLDRCGDLVSGVRTGELHFQPTPEVARVLEDLAW